MRGIHSGGRCRRRTLSSPLYPAIFWEMVKFVDLSVLYFSLVLPRQPTWVARGKRGNLRSWGGMRKSKASASAPHQLMLSLYYTLSWARQSMSNLMFTAGVGVGISGACGLPLGWRARRPLPCALRWLANPALGHERCAPVPGTIVPCSVSA